ncbi:MAG: peptidylprolyl isomerase [Sulfurimonadaceae bacterium]|nr:peptidylprolyl isomerase [Sulfurimonadaceae bacterium]
MKIFAPLITLLLSLNLYAQNPVVVMETTQGTIEIELFKDVAPLAVENFTTHVKNGYYNGIVFHRIIQNFMIQGGDPTGTGRGGESIWGKPFKDEFKPGVVFDRAGILAMANSGPMTNGSQFFITLAPTSWLNGYHTIFGQVVSGMESVKKLGAVPTTGRRGGDRPLERQEILKAYVK